MSKKRTIFREQWTLFEELMDDEEKFVPILENVHICTISIFSWRKVKNIMAMSAIWKKQKLNYSEVLQ